MQNCPFCNAEMPEGVQTCPNCGRNLVETPTANSPPGDQSPPVGEGDGAQQKAASVSGLPLLGTLAGQKHPQPMSQWWRGHHKRAEFQRYMAPQQRRPGRLCHKRQLHLPTNRQRHQKQASRNTFVRQLPTHDLPALKLSGAQGELPRDGLSAVSQPWSLLSLFSLRLSSPSRLPYR